MTGDSVEYERLRAQEKGGDARALNGVSTAEDADGFAYSCPWQSDLRCASG